jgi:hypothetical protein
LIRTINRYPESAFGTWLPIDSEFDQCIRRQKSRDDYYRYNDSHLIEALSPAARHELPSRRVIEERRHEEDHRRASRYHKQRRAAGLISINAQVNENKRD